MVPNRRAAGRVPNRGLGIIHIFLIHLEGGCQMITFSNFEILLTKEGGGGREGEVVVCDNGYSEPLSHQSPQISDNSN